MKIQKIESFCNEFVGFVRVTTRDGTQGWGQVSTYHADITVQVLHRQVAPWVLGRDTTDLDDLLDRVTEREHKFPGSYLRRAMAGFDTAGWDARGQRAGEPVAALWGGSAGPRRRSGRPLHWSSCDCWRSPSSRRQGHARRTRTIRRASAPQRSETGP